MLNQTSVRDILLTSYAQTVILKMSLFSLVLKSSKLFKVCGHDGLAADHFVFTDGSICIYLSLLHSSLLSHGYLPEEFIKSFIVPLIKNKTGDTSDTVIYIPVAIVSACSKRFECLLLGLIEVYSARVTTNLGLRASILLTYVYAH